MHVVGHDHPVAAPTALAVKMAQRVPQGIPNRRSRQQATSLAAIQLHMQPMRLTPLKSTANAEIDLQISPGEIRSTQAIGNSMRDQPGLPFFFPSQQNPAGNGIGKAKRHEISASLLPPMRQIAPV